MQDNQPHRVIFTKSGKQTTRVFGNKTKADEFASGVQDATVQLASEPVTITNSNNSRKLMDNANQTRRVPCECGSGRNRLTSEAHCYSCSGQLDQEIRQEKIKRNAIAPATSIARRT